MTRAPTQAQMRELTELGVFLDGMFEVADGEAVLSSERSARLLWAGKARALIVLHGYKLPRPRRSDALPQRAARDYERWADGREATQMREVELDLPKGPWVELGRATNVGYRSDKFHARGETVDYQHEFETNVRVFRLGTSRRGVVAWRGGRLRLTPDGIEG